MIWIWIKTDGRFEARKWWEALRKLLWMGLYYGSMDGIVEEKNRQRKFLLWLISAKHCSSSTTEFPHSSLSRIKISAHDADDSKRGAFMSLVIARRKSLIRLSSSVQNKCFHLDDDARMPKQRLVNFHELQKKPPKAMNRNGKFSSLRVRGRHLVWNMNFLNSLAPPKPDAMCALAKYRARFFVHRPQLLLV